MRRALTDNNGCGLWAVVALVAMLLLAGLLVYIDRRFGAEASAFFLGISLGIPLLLIMVVIVGGIYVLVIRGTVHLQERDDAGEIGRLRTLGELARTERSFVQLDRDVMRTQRKHPHTIVPDQQRALALTDDADGQWTDDGWDRWEEDETQRRNGGMRILE